MNIEEYLQEHDDFILYRVLSEPDRIPETRFETEKTVKELSNLTGIPYNDLLALYKEASRLVFDGSKKYAIKTSEISIYTWGAKIADIVIIGKDEHKVELDYIKELKKSEKIKKELLEYLNKRVMPIVKDVFKLKNVAAIGHRGSLTIPTRKATPLSDIDLFILLDDSSAETIIEKLKKVPGSVSIINMFQDEKVVETSIKKGKYKVNFDLIPADKFVEAYKNRFNRIDYFTYFFEFMDVFMAKKKFHY